MQRSPLFVVFVALFVLTSAKLSKTTAGEIKPFNFLGKAYTQNDWNEIKSFIHCMSNRGEWTDTGHLSGLIYQAPCYWARYVQGKCETSSLYSQTKGLDYTWTHYNHTCTFPGRPDITIKPFNRNETCRFLTNRNVLILGDSISDEFFYSLGSALIQALEKCMDSKEMKVSYHEVGGNIPYHQFDMKKFQCSNSKLTYMRHDYFMLSQLGDTYAHNTDSVYHGAGWPQIMHQLDTSLLIVNRGAHFVPDDVMLPEINNTLNALRASYGDKLSIIFRSTAPGHVNYDEQRYASPLKSALDAKLNKYHWNEFERQNKLVRQLLRQHHEHVLYLDVYPSTVLRADGHATEDGLHYCIPGPIDQWVVFLYNILNALDQV